MAFAWDHVDSKRGLLRTHVSNNWNITDKMIASDFYSKDQQDMIRAIYEGLFQPDWIPQIDRQLKDDGQGYGKSQSIAMFGKPDEGKFEFVMTGRHMTVRADGHSIDHVAFGGPVFHGHAATGFNEAADHPGNVFWPQALAANKIYEMLDGKQRKVALQPRLPAEAAVDFHGENGPFPGLPVKQLTHDQRDELEKTLAVMLSPYRSDDSDEVMACLKRQGASTLLTGLLQGRRHRRRWRMGQLAIGRPLLRLVLPRLAPRALLDQHRRQRRGEDERPRMKLIVLKVWNFKLHSSQTPMASMRWCAASASRERQEGSHLRFNNTSGADRYQYFLRLRGLHTAAMSGPPALVLVI